MNTMNNVQFYYLIISAVFSGFVLCSAILFAYTHIKIAGRVILAPLLFGCTAFIYMVCDMLALIYAVSIPLIDRARFFVILRGLAPLLFLIATPFFMNQAIELKQRIKKINKYLSRAGIGFLVVITAAAFFSPDLFISIIGSKNPGNYSWTISAYEIGPLFIVTNSLLMAYLLYSIAVFLYSTINHKNVYPVKKILIGLIVLSYFAFTMIFSIIFFRNNAGFGHILYRNFGIGIIIFIIFITFGIIDFFIDNTSQLIKFKKDLKQLIHFDTALGIPNRGGFHADLQSELNEIQARGGNFSLIFLDIDDFQRFNECFGEGVGDEILKDLSLRLAEHFFWAGSLYRIGGDEFAFLSKDIKYEKDAVDLAGKIISSLRNSFTVSRIEYLVTASIGILQIPRDGFDTETILSNAYSVIRKAKKTKNTFAVFTSELLDISSNKINIVNILRNSISRDQFTLFYQPVVDKHGKIIYAESLVRCTNKDNPEIGSPGTFIPLIEEAGLMKEIDDMVVRKAFRDMEVNIRNKFSISINLSTNQLVNTAYSDFLSSFADQHGIENKQIILEVTESKLIENLSSGRDSLTKLKESGFKIALDDFGKGFSSLIYLAELPLDILKIDMELIQSVPGDAKKESIARHIIEMAHSLNLKVVAEGFETREQIDFFKGLECDLFQGYYFSRPVSIDELCLKYPHA